jgi:hypothetical protein
MYTRDLPFGGGSVAATHFGAELMYYDGTAVDVAVAVAPAGRSRRGRIHWPVRACLVDCAGDIRWKWTHGLLVRSPGSGHPVLIYSGCRADDAGFQPTVDMEAVERHWNELSRESSGF